MREIKFRAWDGEEMLDIKEIAFTKSGASIRTGFKTKYRSGVCKNPILMQFTGLKDKSGKEVYEGDKVMATYKKNGEEVSSPGIVEWYDNEGMFVVKLGDPEGENESWGIIKFSALEVFGNMYERGDASA
jgi:uncharacterized phage protein (TIGR01671 family)